MLIEELGGKIIDGRKARRSAGKKVRKKEATKKTGTIKKPSPTFLFGKWKSFDIDSKKLREETWGRAF
jgi:hypothetical protein